MGKVDNNNSIIAVSIALVLFVLSSSVFAQPPDNAALLYYQAFLLYERPDETMSKMLTDFHDGKIGANEVIEQHIEKNHRVIDFIVTAADTPKCDWGYDYSQGFDLVMPNLAQLRRMTYLIEADAKLLGEQGDYKTALDRCLSMHKMALHAADRTIIGYLVAIAISARANTTLPNILKDMPENPDVVSWLKQQLIHIENRFPSPKDYIAYEAEVCASTIQKDKAQAIVEMASNEECSDPNTTELILTADEEFFQRNRDHYLDYMARIQGVLDTDMTYVQAHAKFRQLEEELEQEAKEKQTPLAMILAPAADKIYTLSVRQKTHFNAVKTAIEIYIIKARTGRLPDALPAGLPKDLFSGKDFEYEKKDGGFVLRCQAKDLDKDEIYQYGFDVSD
jgi:hypothetical protein